MYKKNKNTHSLLFFLEIKGVGLSGCWAKQGKAPSDLYFTDIFHYSYFFVPYRLRLIYKICIHKLTHKQNVSFTYLLRHFKLFRACALFRCLCKTWKKYNVILGITLLLERSWKSYGWLYKPSEHGKVRFSFEKQFQNF